MLCADLGCDKIFVYTIDQKSLALTPHPNNSLLMKSGAGPRHIAFHPNGKFLFVISELDNTVTSFEWDSILGKGYRVNSCSTLPKDFTQWSATAEIVAHPNGNFLLGSNRGHDSIAILRCDPKTGVVGLVTTVPAQCKTPRHFAFSPDLQYLLVGGQDSHNIAIFKMVSDGVTLSLTYTNQQAEVPTPVCILFNTASSTSNPIISDLLGYASSFNRRVSEEFTVIDENDL